MFPKKLVWLYCLGFLGILVLVGCGVREPQTGSLAGRVFNQNGDVVDNAEVYSLFREIEKVRTGADGSFFLSNLPTGRNRIIIRHKSYLMDELVVDITPDKHSDLDRIVLETPGVSEKISDTAVLGVSSTTATLTWKTYKAFRCRIEYGEGRGYGKIAEENSEYSHHVYTLTNLTPETVYHARVGFFDTDTTFRFSVDIPFKTSSREIPEPPGPLIISAIPTYGTIQVKWEPSPTSAIGSYRIYRRSGIASWTMLTENNLGKSLRSFSDETAEGGVFYEYGVSAVGENTVESEFAVSSKVFMPGYVRNNVTIASSDSPIFLTSDLIVSRGATLFVGEGVEFQVAASDSFAMGKDPERVEIIVQGRVMMIGEAEKPIRFSPLSGIGKRDFWSGIRIQNGETGLSEIGYVEMSGCASFAIQAEGVSASIHDLQVTYSEGGIMVSNSSNFSPIQNCTITDIASTGILFDRCRNFTVAMSTITRTNTGILVLPAENQNRIQIHENWIDARSEAIQGSFRFSSIKNNVLICENGIGMKYFEAVDDANFLDHNTIDAKSGVFFQKGIPIIENNIIVNSNGLGEIGIQSIPTGSPKFTYNDVFGFTTPYQGCEGGTGARAVKPEFKNERPFLYKLPEASTLRFADWTGAELGRYGKSFR